MDGWCMFCKPDKGMNDESIQRHTFYDQVINNPVITQMVFNIGDLKKKASNKVHNFKEMWEDDKKRPLWDQKSKCAVEKIIDKNPSTTYLEFKMSQYKIMIQEFDEMPKERNAFFISEYFGNVIEGFKGQAKEWLDKHGNVLKTLGFKELEGIKKEIEDYRDKLR